jgi:hypothetical protein
MVVVSCDSRFASSVLYIIIGYYIDFLWHSSKNREIYTGNIEPGALAFSKAKTSYLLLALNKKRNKKTPNPKHSAGPDLHLFSPTKHLQAQVTNPAICC